MCTLRCSFHPVGLFHSTFEMEEVLVQSTTMEKGGSVVLDIESLVQPADKNSGKPKMTKALSRKGSSRMERRNDEDTDADDANKKFIVKVVCSQLDHLKQPSLSSKSLMAVTASVNNTSIGDMGEGRNKRFSRWTTINPRKILLFFASMSSMGTMILIYFTLAINRRGGM